MKKTLLVLVGILVLASVARADEAAVHSAPGVFQKYVVNPTQWIHRGAWGILTLAFKVGKAPIDKGFEMVGSFLGSEPNQPLWQ